MLDPHPSAQAEIRSARPPGDFEAMVGEATRRIDAGEMRKVVLAREVLVTSPSAHDPAALFGAMREQFSSCFCFCCGTPEAAFIGASPELLVRRSGASVSTVALAGSTRRSSDPAVDDHLGEQLLRSDKNRREQRIVSERIVRTLRPHAVWVEAARRAGGDQGRQHPAPGDAGDRPARRTALGGRARRPHAPDPGGRRRAARARRRGDIRAGGDGPRLVRRPDRLDGRHRGRRVLRRPAQRACCATATRISTPASASSPAPTRRPSSRRPRSSCRRCCRCSPIADAARPIVHDWGVIRRVGAGGAALLATIVLVGGVAAAAEPVGARFAYTEAGEGPSRLEIRTLGISGFEPRTIAGGRRGDAGPFPYFLQTPSWSGDGTQLAFTGISGEGQERTRSRSSWSGPTAAACVASPAPRKGRARSSPRTAARSPSRGRRRGAGPRVTGKKKRPTAARPSGSPTWRPAAPGA